MARATTTKPPARKPRMTVSDAPPKRKPGRPLGSTNAKKTPPASSARAPKPAARRAAVSAPAPKMNKADLEAHVAKLERTVSRLREKNKELKQAASDAREHADTLEVQLSSRPAAAKPPRKPRRSASTSATTLEPDTAETEPSED